MLKVFIFLIVTSIILALNGIFFEYFISREMSLGLVTIASLVLAVANTFYLRYIVKSLQKTLKLK